ncbi:MAG TPA: GntR family transcriptional regulator [Burkholderiaceae bacterium]|jgi:DNA-binding GntR family transcriptional regulator
MNDKKRTRKAVKATGDASVSAVSASRRVYLALRQRIVDMDLPPGARIVELDIAAEHGVSRTPVHEAVQRLAEEGLIDIQQRVGTFVARIPINELEEAMLVRTALELTIVEKAAAQANPEDIARLRTILEEQRTCMQAKDADGFHRGDEAFHATLAEIAGCPGVWRTILQTKTQVDRFRRLTLPIEGRMKGVIEEHSHVVDELAKGRGEHATAAMREHLDHVLPVIEVTRAFRPDYFVNLAPHPPGR